MNYNNMKITLIILLGSVSILNALAPGEVFDYKKGYAEKGTESYVGVPEKETTFYVKSYLNMPKSKISTKSHRTKTCELFRTYYKSNFRGYGICQDGYVRNEGGDTVNSTTILKITQDDLDKMKRIYEPEIFSGAEGIYKKGPTKSLWKAIVAKNYDGEISKKLKVIDRESRKFILQAELMGAAPLNYKQKLYLIKDSDLGRSTGSSSHNITIKKLKELTDSFDTQEIDYYHTANRNNIKLAIGEEAHEFGKLKCEDGELFNQFNKTTNKWEYYCKVKINIEEAAQVTTKTYNRFRVEMVSGGTYTPKVDLNAGLIGYFPLGNNISEIHKNSRARKYGYWPNSGFNGNSYNFTGRQQVYSNVKGLPESSKSRTFSMWISKYKTPHPHNHFFSYGRHGQNQFFGLSARRNGSLSLHVWYGGYTFRNSRLPNNKMVHVVVTYKYPYLKLYMNGKHKDTKSIRLSTKLWYQVMIGSSRPGYSREPWYGRIGKVRIYNKELNNVAVNEIYTLERRDYGITLPKISGCLAGKKADYFGLCSKPTVTYKKSPGTIKTKFSYKVKELTFKEFYSKRDPNSKLKKNFYHRFVDLTNLKNALDSYYQVHKAYPKSNAWDGLYTNYGTSSKNWIKGLVPKYISKLPRDPRNHTNKYQQYIYRSNGKDYKLISHIPEDCAVVAKEYSELKSPVRNCWAYGVWTVGAERW